MSGAIWLNCDRGQPSGHFDLPSFVVQRHGDQICERGFCRPPGEYTDG